MTALNRALGAWRALDDEKQSEAALIERCCKGDESAYSALYTHYAAYIYRLVYGFLQHKEDSEEVLQDTFDYAFRRIGHYDARKASFKTWLYQIAVSRCRNKRRRRWLPALSFRQLDESAVPDPHAVIPEELLALSARQKVIWRALQDLSAKLRETAVLRYYEGLSYPEIGQILGIPSKTAESRMRLAHAALKEALAEQFLDED